MAASTEHKNLANAIVITIDGVDDYDSGYKAIVQVLIPSGTITLTPSCVLRGVGLVVGDGKPIEYNKPDASATKLTVNIATAGIYEFFLDGKTLFLTVSGFTAGPRVFSGLARV